MSGGLSRGRANPHNLTAAVDSGLGPGHFCSNQSEMLSICQL